MIVGVLPVEIDGGSRRHGILDGLTQGNIAASVREEERGGVDILSKGTISLFNESFTFSLGSDRFFDR